MIARPDLRPSKDWRKKSYTKLATCLYMCGYTKTTIVQCLGTTMPNFDKMMQYPKRYLTIFDIEIIFTMVFPVYGFEELLKIVVCSNPLHARFYDRLTPEDIEEMKNYAEKTRVTIEPKLAKTKTVRDMSKHRPGKRLSSKIIYDYYCEMNKEDDDD